MKAIIVDDEPKAIELLKSYIAHFSSIELVGTFRNGLKAFDFIRHESVDLIFLDINMPHISGISLSKMLPNNIQVVFTTAYSEYAVESYEIQALDYLVKPISLERFTQSISRILPSSSPNEIDNERIITVKSGQEIFRVDSSNIFYLAKDGNYMNYHCANKKIMARESIKESLEKLPDNFVQTHKSFIVNIEKIESFNSNELSLKTDKIPISETYKNEVLKRLV